MAVTIECPDCGAVLRPAKPVAAGKKIRCPKCENTFAVPTDEDEAVEERQATAVKKKSAAPPKKPAAKKSAPAPASAPAPKLDDDGEGGTYGVVDTPEKEAEEDANKPKIEYAPDVTITDPRGAATAALATPSTLILVLGSLMAISGIVAVGVFCWPFMFSKDGTSVKPAEARVIYEEEKYDILFEKWKKTAQPGDQPPRKPEVLNKDAPLPEVKVEHLSSKRDEGQSESEREIYDDMKAEDVQMRTVGTILSFIGLVYGGFMAGIAVKMTNLESFKWSMTASILACGTLAGLPLGIWAITLLKKDETKAAFEYDPEDH